MPSIAHNSQPFLEHLDHWYANLPTVSVNELINNAPEKVAVTCVDIIVGFCTDGALSSPRVQSIVAPIAELFTTFHDAGVEHFLLPQDAHPENAVEFGAFPVHCVRNTKEAETAPELLALPFADTFTIFEKNALAAATNPEFAQWVRDHDEVDTYIVTGDCTDLCVYQLAMFLRLDANARNVAGRRVILPANCIDTYDTPLHIARELGIPAHPGDFHHLVFLHHMYANGVEIVKSVE